MSIAFNEIKRLKELQSLQILDTPADFEFDRLTRTAAKVFNVPIALISLVDHSRQWFKSAHGICATEMPREHAFCAVAIVADEVMIIEDATKDSRFENNPLVVGEPEIRFYAGYPISTRNGHRIGTFCIVDTKPRTLDERDASMLGDFAGIAFALIEARLSNIEKSNPTTVSVITNNLAQRIGAAVQHQFSNILSIALGNVDLLKRELPESMRDSKRLEAIRKAAERGVRFTRQFNSLSNLPAPDRAALNVGDAVLAAFPDIIAGAPADMRIDRPHADDACWARVNNEDLVDCMAALVSNAVAATKGDGAITIAVRTVATASIPDGRIHRRPGTKKTVLISVKDTGQGMNDEVAAKAWDPFFTTQLDSAVLGMGLTAVRVFAHQAGGDIAIETSPGKGTEVTIYLPAADAADTSTHLVSVKSEGAPAPSEPPHTKQPHAVPHGELAQ